MTHVTYPNTGPFWTSPTSVPISIPLINEKNVYAINTDQIVKSGNKNTHVIFILDESGSMEEKKKMTIKSFNKFVKSQKKEGKKLKEDTYITLLKFNGMSVDILYRKVDINEVNKLDENTYKPNGGTNLLDSIGDAIGVANFSLLEKSKEEDRERIILVVLTDGEENCSVRYDNAFIKKRISLCEENEWSFIYLGVGLEAFGNSANYGFTNLNSLHIGIQSENVSCGIEAASTMTSRLRNYEGAASSKYECVKFTQEEKDNSRGE